MISDPSALVAAEHPHLDESQRRAVVMALSRRACICAGGAGVGKTTIIRAIYSLYKRVGLRCSLCAPTGKAARRMEQLVPGARASTIHRLLEYQGGRGSIGGFQRNEANPLSDHAVIVDESSMCDSALVAALLAAVPSSCSITFVGDHHQLPPVGAGAFLRDCIARELLPMTILNQCHRQAGPLKTNAAAILQGVVAPTVKLDGKDAGPWYVHDRLADTRDVLATVERLWREVLPRWEYDVIKDVQFLTPQHSGPIGTRAINALLQRLHQKSLGVEVEVIDPEKRPKLYRGDKVICTRNNYELDVMNGAMGTVLDAKHLTVDFEGRPVYFPAEFRGDVELGYALTPHKFQGSEIPCAITLVHKSNSYMLHRNWLYTAATRASKTNIIMGDAVGIRRAAERIVTNQRRTLLPTLVDLAKAGERVV